MTTPFSIFCIASWYLFDHISIWLRLSTYTFLIYRFPFMCSFIRYPYSRQCQTMWLLFSCYLLFWQIQGYNVKRTSSRQIIHFEFGHVPLHPANLNSSNSFFSSLEYFHMSRPLFFSSYLDYTCAPRYASFQGSFFTYDGVLPKLS